MLDRDTPRRTGRTKSGVAVSSWFVRGQKLHGCESIVELSGMTSRLTYHWGLTLIQTTTIGPELYLDKSVTACF